jgi:hypothetical protein
MLKRSLAILLALVVVAFALSACGSSSSSSSSSPSPAGETAGGSSTEAGEGGVAAELEGGGEGSEGASEVEVETREIVLRNIFGRFGGNAKEYDIEAGTCKIDKINVNPAAIKADPKAILDHEKTASVSVSPLKGPTQEQCEKALELAIE